MSGKRGATKSDGSFLQRVRNALKRRATINELVALLNERYAVVSEGGRTTIIKETIDPALDRRVVLRMSFGDFRNYYHFQVEVGRSRKDDPQYKTLGNLWVDSANRRQYEAIVFAPLETKPGCFNLWRGFAVVPRQGDWSMMARHVRDVICDGNEELYRYVMGWMAARVQRPGTPAEVALVLRGPRGSGKSIFARQFGSLFGQHFIHISHPRHLTGNFNAHLQDAVVIFADEAFGTARQADQGVLKTLITEPTISIEPKGHDVIFVRNCAGLIIASNSPWVVPAGLDERRYCVLDVSGTYARQHEYFDALLTQMDAGGREAMLFDLQYYDLEDFNIRTVPSTAALDEQKIFSMKPHERWWYQKLRDGHLLPEHSTWVNEVIRDVLVADYAESVGRSRGHATASELGMYLRSFVPGLGETRKAIGTQRKWCWVFPSLADCRAAFERLTHTTYDWPSDDSGSG